LLGVGHVAADDHRQAGVALYLFGQQQAGRYAAGARRAVR
jgi:hypothetical protein